LRECEEPTTYFVKRDFIASFFGIDTQRDYAAYTSSIYTQYPNTGRRWLYLRYQTTCSTMNTGRQFVTILLTQDSVSIYFDTYIAERVATGIDVFRLPT